MKKITLLVVSIILLFQAHAQYNTELIDTTKLWSSWRGGSWLPPDYRISSYHKFQGDTVINQISYKKIWESLDEPQLNWELKGFIHSDENESIYVRDLFDNEGLIYNFNVQVGDTFTLYNPFNEGLVFEVLIAEKDSTFIIPANQFRKRIKLQGNDIWAGEEYWIEGIGSSAGILMSGADIVQLTGWAMYDPLCQWENDTLVYSNPEYNSCFITVSTPEIELESPKITIHPNPLVYKSTITINGIQAKNYTIEIFDISGIKVLDYHIQADEKIVINKEMLEPGLYLINLNDGNNTSSRTKLIIQ